MSSGFITRATLKPSAIASILLRDAHRDGAHALVWTLFQHQPKGERCFLYRAEEEAPSRFLIVSTVPPEDPEGLWQFESKPFEPELSVGDALHFSLRVNPAVTWRDGKTTRRADVVMKAKKKLDSAERHQTIDREALVRDWLEPRLMERGASLGACALLGWQVKRHRAGSRFHNVAVADLEGVLTVTDPGAVTSVLFEGLGKARAYGCGLLLVRRA